MIYNPFFMLLGLVCQFFLRVFPSVFIRDCYIDYHMLNQFCVLGINCTWSSFVILFICCWIWFATIFIGIFLSMFIKDIGSFFCDVFGFDIKVIPAAQNELGNIFSSSLFWKHLKRTGVNSHLSLLEFASCNKLNSVPTKFLSTQKFSVILFEIGSLQM